MKHEVKVPAMGESISEATVSAILKPAGSRVKMDDELLELATDKVNQVLYAQESGIFTPTVNEEEVVKIGQVIGTIDSEGKEKPQEPKQQSSQEPKQEEKAKEEAGTKQEPQTLPPKKEVEDSSASKARFMPEEFLKDLSAPPKEKQTPTAAQATSETPPKEEKKSVAAGRREERNKMTRIRKVIASRLVEVQSNTAMLTTFNEVDLTEIMAIREKHKESFSKEHGTRLGLMSFFVKASISALMKFPGVNSYIDGEDLVQRFYYDIGIAVGTDKGLVVPVVRDCDKLSFAEIEQAIAAYATKVKEGKLTADDLSGGGFTITNGGVYGSLLSTPILNPRQCGILGMHKIMKRPVVVNDQIVIRQMMYLALSYDHRIIDGKEAVSFLVHIKNLLEDPSKMLLDI